MKKIILILSITMALLTPVGLTLTNPISTASADIKSKITEGKNSTGESSDTNRDIKTVIKNVTNMALFIIGVAAVIVIIYSGIQFIIAAGNPQTVSKAKTTLIYAIVGLVVAIMAYAIVNFVIDNLAK